MNTIFITSFHPLISRNILQTTLLALLTVGGNRVVILAPDFKRDYFVKQFCGERVVVEGVPTELTRRDLFFRKLALAVTPTRTLYLKKRSQWYRDGNIVQFLCSLLPAYLLGRCAYGVKLAQFVDHSSLRRTTFQSLFERYTPDLVFATDVQNELDVRLLQEAKRAHIKTIGMVRSWDNLTTKGIMRAIPDHLVTHNEIIKGEAVRYSYVPAECILPIGVPHYDRYHLGPTKTREEFFKDHHFDIAKKLIVVGPIGNRYIHENQTDMRALEILSELDCNILVRIPPCDVVNYDGFSSRRAKVSFDKAGVSSWKGGRKLNEMSREDEERLVNALFWSDVVVSHLSTMCIDAAVFKKPVVVIGNRFTEHPRWDIINYYYEYEHIQPVLKSGGIRIAHRPKELLPFVREYLKHPNRDAEGRERIVREEVQFVDGKATERLAGILLT